MDALLTKDENASSYILKSPVIGFIKLLVADDQFVLAGQEIAEVQRLSKTFYINVPNGISGRVLINPQLLASIQYEEEIIRLSLQPDALIKTSDSSKKYNPNQSSLTPITSPMAGMIYLRTSPKSEPFIKIGERLEQGQPIALIEVMKCFYPIKYEGSAPVIVESINAQEASPINHNDVIMWVKSF